jgi:hypothetical protein
MTGQQHMSQNPGEGKQPQQGRGGTGNGFVGPLTLCFQAEMFAGVAKGGFHLPAALEENENIEWVQGRVDGQQCEGELASHFTDKDEEDNDRQLLGMIPNGLMGAQLNLAQLVVVPDNRQACPTGGRVIDDTLHNCAHGSVPLPAVPHSLLPSRQDCPDNQHFYLILCTHAIIAGENSPKTVIIHIGRLSTSTFRRG